MRSKKLTDKFLRAMLIFTLGGQQITFISYPEKHLWVNQSCSSAAHCKAWQAYENLLTGKIAWIDTNPTGLGARLCEKSLGGKLVIGTDSNSNENSFCGFSDSSWIDSGSLTYAAQKRNPLRKK